MKEMYDKNVTPHHYVVGDIVMLWNPPHRTGLSRSFQPKWQGPWTIIELIGNTNCQLENDKGVRKYVHLNQLKKIVKRNQNFKSEFIPYECTNPESTQYVDPLIFDNFSDFVLGKGTAEDNTDDGPRYPIDNAYVDIDESNILENKFRTRR